MDRSAELQKSRKAGPRSKDRWQVSTYATPGGLQNLPLGLGRFHSFDDSPASDVRIEEDIG